MLRNVAISLRNDSISCSTINNLRSKSLRNESFFWRQRLERIDWLSGKATSRPLRLKAEGVKTFAGGRDGERTIRGSTGTDALRALT